MSEQEFNRVQGWVPAVSSQTQAAQPVTPALFLRIWGCGIGGLGLVCIFWPMPFLLTALLALTAGLMLSGRKRVADVVLVAFCGAFGAIAESFGIAAGAWVYTVPLAAGVPLWLPLIWGIAALFVKEIALQIQFVMRELKIE